MGKDIVIIGGGVIGLCSAYYLGRAGHRVTIIDRDVNGTESCSDKNAGMIVPSHFIPLAAPGVISQGLKWMWNPKSPFYMRPRLNLNLWNWCWHFFRHANARHVANTQELLRDLALESRSLYRELSGELGFTLNQRGLLMLCRSEAGFHEEKEVAHAAEKLGIAAEICSPERICELDPDVTMDVLGGVWFSQDCHLDPAEFLASLRKAIIKNGGTFLAGECLDLETENQRVKSIKTASGETIKADHFVLAGGAWTPEMSRKLGLRIPMQGGKGYSFTLASPVQLPQLCSLLKEGRCAITPMHGTLRVAGTMEICGNNLSIDRKRLQGIIEAFCRFFPEFSAADFEGLEAWSGLRPCSPDGLPYLGPVPGYQNVTLSTGHSMLGMSLGPVTGRIIADSVDGKAVDSRMRSDRF